MTPWAIATWWWIAQLRPQVTVWQKHKIGEKVRLESNAWDLQVPTHERVMWKKMASILHHPWANVCSSCLTLLTSESLRDDCLHFPTCSKLVSHLFAGASEHVILCGCAPVTPYDTFAIATSLLMPVQLPSYRRTTVRAGGKAFPSEHGVSAYHFRGRKGDDERKRQEGKLLAAWRKAGGLESGGPHRTSLLSCGRRYSAGPGRLWSQGGKVVGGPLTLQPM